MFMFYFLFYFVFRICFYYIFVYLFMCCALTDTVTPTHTHILCDITLSHPHTHTVWQHRSSQHTHCTVFFFYFLQSVVTWQIHKRVKWEVSFVLSLGKTQMKACNPVSTPHILPEVYPFDCIIIASGNIYSWVQILWITMHVVNKIFSLQFSFITIFSIRGVTVNLHHKHTWFNTVILFTMWNKFIYFFQ